MGSLTVVSNRTVIGPSSAQPRAMNRSRSSTIVMTSPGVQVSRATASRKIHGWPRRIVRRSGLRS